MQIKPLNAISRPKYLPSGSRGQTGLVGLLILVVTIAISSFLIAPTFAVQPADDNCGFWPFAATEPDGYQNTAPSDCAQATPETFPYTYTFPNGPLTITVSGGRFSPLAGGGYRSTSYTIERIPCGPQTITVNFSRPVLSVHVTPWSNGGTYGSRSITVSDNVGDSTTIQPLPNSTEFPVAALTAPFPGPGMTQITLTSTDGLSFALGAVGLLVPENDCYPVKTLEMIAVNSPLDNNPNLEAGQRIFPDKLTSGDTVDRKRVRIKAYTASGANKTIFFRSFDLDDPSSGAGPVDSNDTSGPTGNDNRGIPGLGIISAVGGTGTTNVVSALTDSNGIAQADLTVSLQPGDNFIVAAGADQTYLNSVAVDGLSLREDGSYGGQLLPTLRAQQTSMLTVWRRLHVEVDSMGLVAANLATGKTSTVTPNTATSQTTIAASTTLEVNRFQNGRIILNNVGTYSVVSNTANSITVQGIINSVPRNTNYTLYDDDDFNSNDGVILDGDVGEDVVAFTQTLSLMQTSDNPLENVFAPAYIRPIYDGGGSAGNDTSNIAFSLNIPLTTTAINTQLNRGRNSGANESDNFWVVYLQMGYQGDLMMDIDPGTESAVGGATTQVGSVDDVTSSAGVVTGGQGSLIYVEGSRDGDLTIMIGDDFKLRTAPHEVGHQFGLRGDAAGLGIMSQSTSREPLSFVDRHLNVLRWRVKSPGQP